MGGNHAGLSCLSKSRFHPVPDWCQNQPRSNWNRDPQFLYVSSALYTPSAFCTKVTLLLLISRAFSVHPTLSRSIYIFIATLFLAYTPLVFLKIFTCRPISAYWELPPARAGVSGNNPNCLDQAQFFMGDILIAAITDLIILLLPAFLAWKMEAPRRQKIKIGIMLGAGGVATATTVVRIHLNLHFMHSTSMSAVPAYLISANGASPVRLMPAENLQTSQKTLPHPLSPRKSLAKITLLQSCLTELP